MKSVIRNESLIDNSQVADEAQNLKTAANIFKERIISVTFRENVSKMIRSIPTETNTSV